MKNSLRISCYSKLDLFFSLSKVRSNLCRLLLHLAYNFCPLHITSALRRLLLPFRSFVHFNSWCDERLSHLVKSVYYKSISITGIFPQFIIKIIFVHSSIGPSVIATARTASIGLYCLAFS